MKTRNFWSSDFKRSYTATKNGCDCTGYRFRRKCGHQKFMSYPHKKHEKADKDFKKFFFRLVDEKSPEKIKSDLGKYQKEIEKLKTKEDVMKLKDFLSINW